MCVRSWKLINNSRVVDNFKITSSCLNLPIENNSSQDGDNEGSSDDNNDDEAKLGRKSVSDIAINVSHSKPVDEDAKHLSKSMSAVDNNCVTSEEDEMFSDAKANNQNTFDHSKDVFVSAAMSIDYASCPQTTKYIRAKNIITSWAMRPVEGEENSCIFEWILCVDLKGCLPKYVVNSVRFPFPCVTSSSHK